MKSLNIREFDDIMPYTKTYTASVNASIDIYKVFKMIDIVPYSVVPKKRGRKRKGEKPVVEQTVPYGSIIYVNHEGNIRGVCLKPPSKNKEPSWFKNAISIVIMLDKPINFKVSGNGKFQMTGCLNHTHPEMCIKKIWEILQKDPTAYTFTREPESFEAMIIPSMRNISISLGFNVDRDKLNRFLQNQALIHCLLETTFWYTGANIKVPITTSRFDTDITKIRYEDGEWIKTNAKYDEFVDILPEEEQKKKLNEKRFNTFLVFHSGQVIFSGLTRETMRDMYYKFMNLMENARDQIEEKLEK